MEKVLCDDASEGLKLLSDSTHCDDGIFKIVLERVNSILKSHNPEKLKGEQNGCIQEKMTSALLILLTETCRRGLDKDQLDFLLKDHNFTSKRIEMVMKLLESVKPSVTLELDSTGAHHPHIISSNWSLNYCVKDSSSEHVNSLEFLVDLQTQGLGGREETVQFACSVAEMQDLVAQLKEALKHVEKLATG